MFVYYAWNESDLTDQTVLFSYQQNIYVTGPAKTGHICTNYTCSENGTFLGPYMYDKQLL